MMKKQMFLILSICMLVLMMVGSVAADDSSDGGVINSSSITDDDQILGNESDYNQNSTEQELVDPIIGVKVNYEYSDDIINPEIVVKDSTGANINFNKTIDPIFGHYIVSFLYLGANNGTNFNVSVSAPGYITQTQQIAVNFNPNNSTDPNLYGNATFNMKATDNYKLGRTVTSIADSILNFASADQVLAITTAGVPKLNGVTSEDCIEGILNAANGKITYGKGNLLMLRQTAVDTVDFAFIIKKGTTLSVVVFRNGSTTPIYNGTISENMTHTQWNTYVQKVGNENGFAFASLANAWAAGAPINLLSAAAFHGHICDGTLGGYSITQALLKYYPPLKESGVGVGSPGDITSYKIIGVPGGSDDDAVMYFLDATPGKGAYIGFDTTNTGATIDMLGIIRWDDQTKLGDLIIMRYNTNDLKKQFTQETGIEFIGSLEELKFNSWIIKKLNTDPTSLVNFIKELKGLNESQFYYIVGTASNITNADGSVRIPAQEAHGLDMNYINSLNLENAVRDTVASGNGQLTYEQIKQIGIDAANLAIQIFKNELGIDLEKDDRNLAVLTSAGYVYLNGQTTEATWDGIFSVIGSRLSRSTLLPVHMGIWKPLWFNFVLRDSDGTTMNNVYLRYNPENQTFFIGTSNIDRSQVNDIGPAALNNASKVNDLSKYVIPDGNWFNIQSIANAWRNNPQFDQLITFLFHDHACPGVQPGFFMTDHITQNIPLGPNETYYYMASSIYCKDDSLIYLLGVSPGMGTYLNQRLINEDVASELIQGGTEEGIIIVWDNVLNIGRAYVITFKWATLDLSGLTTSEAKREAQIAAYISMYNNEPNDRVIEKTTTVISDERIITRAEFDAIKQGGTSSTNALEFLRSIPIRKLSDLIKVPGGSENNNNQNNKNDKQPVVDGSNTNGANNNGGYNTHGGSSVGTSSLPISAATQIAVQAADTGDSSQKSYEVSKATNAKESNNSNWYIYGLVGILALGGLAGFGFMKGGIGGKI